MRIDRDNGRVSVGDVTLSPDLTPHQLFLAPGGEQWHGGFRRDLVDNDPTLSSPARLIVQVYFNEDRLTDIDLFFYLPNENPSHSWDDWSQEDELRRKALHDRLLAGTLGSAGPVYTYTWGTVRSIYDERSGASLIIIRYR